jgi:hypothetical protein
MAKKKKSLLSERVKDLEDRETLLFILICLLTITVWYLLYV